MKPCSTTSIKQFTFRDVSGQVGSRDGDFAGRSVAVVPRRGASPAVTGSVHCQSFLDSAVSADCLYRHRFDGKVVGCIDGNHNATVRFARLAG